MSEIATKTIPSLIKIRYAKEKRYLSNILDNQDFITKIKCNIIKIAEYNCNGCVQCNRYNFKNRITYCEKSLKDHFPIFFKEAFLCLMYDSDEPYLYMTVKKWTDNIYKELPFVKALYKVIKYIEKKIQIYFK